MEQQSNRISQLTILSSEKSLVGIEEELDKCIDEYAVPYRKTMLACCYMASFVPVQYFTREMDSSIHYPLMDHLPFTSIVRNVVSKVESIYRSWFVVNIKVIKFSNAYEFIKQPFIPPIEYADEVATQQERPIDKTIYDSFSDSDDDNIVLTDTNRIVPRCLLFFFGCNTRPLDVYNVNEDVALSSFLLFDGCCVAIFAKNVFNPNSF